MFSLQRLEEATVFLQAAQQADILGPQHSSSISAAAALALAYAKQSRYTEALALYRQTAHSAAEGLGKHHATTLDLRLGVADTLRQLGQNDEAAATGARLLRAHRRALKTQASRSDQLRLARAIELVLSGRIETLPKRLKLIEEAAEAGTGLMISASRGIRLVGSFARSMASSTSNPLVSRSCAPVLTCYRPMRAARRRRAGSDEPWRWLMFLKAFQATLRLRRALSLQWHQQPTIWRCCFAVAEKAQRLRGCCGVLRKALQRTIKLQS